MANHARLDDVGTVLEVADDATLATHADALKAGFQSAPDDVAAGWTHTKSGLWKAPKEGAPEAAPTTTTIDVTALFGRMTPDEEVELRSSDNAIAGVILRRLDDPRLQRIDLTAAWLVDGLARLTSSTSLTDDRVAELLAPAPL